MTLRKWTEEMDNGLFEVGGLGSVTCHRAEESAQAAGDARSVEFLVIVENVCGGMNPAVDPTHRRPKRRRLCQRGVENAL